MDRYCLFHFILYTVFNRGGVALSFVVIQSLNKTNLLVHAPLITNKNRDHNYNISGIYADSIHIYFEIYAYINIILQTYTANKTVIASEYCTMISTKSNNGSPSCWICLCDEPDDTGLLPVRDCSCRGDSAGYAHLSCLVKYAQTKSTEILDNPNSRNLLGVWII